MFVITLFLIINLLLKNRLKSNLKFFSITFFTIVSILIHEGIALLMFPFIYYLLKKKTDNLKIHKLYFITCLLTFIIVILNEGTPENSDQIRIHFLWRIICFEVGRDAITTIGWSLYDTFFLTTFTLIFSGSMFLWLFYIALMVVSIFVILDIPFSTISTINPVALLKENLIFLFIVPIFIVGFDWGRWIFSIFYFLFFTLINTESVKKINSFKVKELIFLVISFFTIMPECCLEMTKGDMITKNLYRVFESIIFHLS